MAPKEILRSKIAKKTFAENCAENSATRLFASITALEKEIFRKVLFLAKTAITQGPSITYVSNTAKTVSPATQLAESQESTPHHHNFI